MMSLRSSVPLSALLATLLTLITIAIGVLRLVEVPLTKTPPAPAAAISAGDIVSLINNERTRKGVPELARNAQLTEAAQAKAEDMARNRYYAHVSPKGKAPPDFIHEAGYRFRVAGENLVIDRKTAGEAVDAWMESPGHRENILRTEFTETGVGVADGVYEGERTIFVVQEFAAPLPAVTTPTPTAPKKTVVSISTPSTKLAQDVKKLVAPLVSAKVAAKPISAIPVEVPLRPAATSTATSTVSTSTVAVVTASTTFEHFFALAESRTPVELVAKETPATSTHVPTLSERVLLLRERVLARLKAL